MTFNQLLSTILSLRECFLFLSHFPLNLTGVINLLWVGPISYTLRRSVEHTLVFSLHTTCTFCLCSGDSGVINSFILSLSVTHRCLQLHSRMKLFFSYPAALIYFLWLEPPVLSNGNIKVMKPCCKIRVRKDSHGRLLPYQHGCWTLLRKCLLDGFI